jgi:hypothetical protein
MRDRPSRAGSRLAPGAQECAQFHLPAGALDLLVAIHIEQDTRFLASIHDDSLRLPRLTQFIPV